MSPMTITVGLAQIAPRLGDIDHNLALTGYPSGVTKART